MGILASLASISGLFGMEIDEKIHEIEKLELKILPVVQSACFHLYSLRFESILEMEGYEGQNAALTSVAILTFFTNFNILRLWMDQSA